MNTALEFLVEMREAIKDNYKDKDGNPISCLDIALEIAKRLISEKKSPYLIKITKKPNKETNPPECLNGYSRCLKPKLYQGRLHWSTHYACCENNLVYDPLIESPLEIKEYLNEAFGLGAEGRIVKSPEQIAKMICIGAYIS